METTDINIQSVWNSKDYYHQSKQASKIIDHPALLEIKKLTANSNRVLEVGCGEGTKLNKLVPRKAEAFGVDISPMAIKLAKKQYPKINFIQANAIKLPFDDNYFDLVYSAFMLEHTENPKTVIKEMIRVLKPKGILALVAPNYGAAHRCSPCYRGNRFYKFASGLLNDYLALVKSNSSTYDELRWLKLKPLAKQSNYHIDWDTTVEPYLGSLIGFLKYRGMKIRNFSSCWEVVEEREKLSNKFFRKLGQLKFYPFIYWGPHLYISAEKN